MDETDHRSPPMPTSVLFLILAAGLAVLAFPGGSEAAPPSRPDMEKAETAGPRLCHTGPDETTS
jgi:hypothetical protein